MIWIIVGVVVVALAIYAMVSVSMSNMPKEKKMVWFAFVVLVPFIGPVVYYIKRPDQAPPLPKI